MRDYNAGGLAHYLNRAELETMARELGALEDGETVGPESGTVTMSAMGNRQRSGQEKGDKTPSPSTSPGKIKSE